MLYLLAPMAAVWPDVAITIPVVGCRVAEIPEVNDLQAAVRLLACVCAGAVAEGSEAFGPDVVAVLWGQARLQAIDFWVRYPDYLANELINEFEGNGNRDDLLIARSIYGGREPDLRRIPMVRYRFGAFEPLDNPLAILRSLDLVRVSRAGRPGNIREHAYLLTVGGRAAMDRMSEDCEELAWYRERALVSARISGEAGGGALKARQYLQEDYAGTPLRATIPSITEKVRQRLDAKLRELEP